MQAADFKRYLDDGIIPVVEWFSGANAARIGEMAKQQGLRTAVAGQTKYLVDWYYQVYEGARTHNLREAYDFWGRGGFARVASAVRAVPDSAIAVDAFTLDDIRWLARLLCPLFDTVIVKWKGAFEPDFGIGVFRDP
ncbi:MAG TPA: hypothetical protein VGG19_04385, partial [Tepidisphaeraceae bacterium]